MSEDFPGTAFEKALEDALGAKMRLSDELCREVWSALANIKWFDKDNREMSYTFRGAGGLIAYIIDRGNYLDWYCSGPYETVSKQIEDAMKERGWRWEKWPDD
jgi:hypothetical protein